MIKKTLLIPVIGLSIAGLLIFNQNKDTQLETKESHVEAIKPLSLSLKNKGLIEKKHNMPALVESHEISDEILVEHIQIDINQYDHLRKGDQLSFFIPQEQQGFPGTVTDSYQQFDGKVTTTNGSIDNGKQFASFTVTKGLDLTLIMLATGDKIYQIEINNKTGEGTVIDDQELDIYRKHDDAVTTPPEGIS